MEDEFDFFNDYNSTFLKNPIKKDELKLSYEQPEKTEQRLLNDFISFEY